MNATMTRLDSLGTAARVAHTTFGAARGQGKAAALETRRAALEAFLAALVEAGLHADARIDDALDIAMDRTTVQAVNDRLAAIEAERATEAEPVAPARYLAFVGGTGRYHLTTVALRDIGLSVALCGAAGHHPKGGNPQAPGTVAEHTLQVAENARHTDLAFCESCIDRVVE